VANLMLPTNGESNGSYFFVDGSMSFLMLMVNPFNERLNFDNRIMVESWMEVEGQGGSGQSCNDDDNEAGRGEDNDYYWCSMIWIAW